MFIRNAQVRRQSVSLKSSNSFLHQQAVRIARFPNSIVAMQDINMTCSYHAKLSNQFIIKNHSATPKKTLSYLDPRHVYFTQPNVSFHFKDGRELADLIGRLENNAITPEEVPLIQVIKYQGKYYSLDNRRLCAFKSAGLASMPVQLVSFNDEGIAKRFKQRFDPIRGTGKYVIICSNKERQSALALMKEQGVINGIGITSQINISKKNQSQYRSRFFSVSPEPKASFVLPTETPSSPIPK